MWTVLDEVKGIFNVAVDTSSIVCRFKFPSGYYSLIAYRCEATADENIGYEAVVPPESDYVQCFDLKPGYNYSISFVTAKGDYYAITSDYSAKTGKENHFFYFVSYLKYKNCVKMFITWWSILCDID